MVRSSFTQLRCGLAGHRGPWRVRIREEESGMITIRKAVARRVPPDELQAGLAALSSGPGPSGSGPDGDAAAVRLRELALHLATYPDLHVSVITYEDGSTELQ